MRSVSTVWAGLTPVQRALVAAVVGIAAILGGLKATSWAENSLGRPRYEVVWETELPEADRAYATVTSDGQYVVVLHREWIKRAYKLSPDGGTVWALEFAPKQSSTRQVDIGPRGSEPSGRIYNESLGVWGVIATADGGAMTYGGINRVFNRPTVPDSESTGYVASIGNDGKLRWQGEIRPSRGWRIGPISGLSQAVPYGTGGLFFSQASRARESSAGAPDDKPNFAIAWWLQLDADGKVVAEHFDLEAERAGYTTSFRAPVRLEGTLYLLRGSRRVVDLATRKELPFGEPNETIVELNPASGATKPLAELPYTCTRLVPIATGFVLSCYDSKFDLAVANGLAVWLDTGFRVIASPMVRERANPRRGIGGGFIVPEGDTQFHSAGSLGSAIGGRQVRVGLLDQSGEIVVQRRFLRFVWHAQAWRLIRGLEADTLLLVRTEYARYDLPINGRTVVTLLRFVR